MMMKILKGILITITLLVAVIISFGLVFSEAQPEGTKGLEAEQLAESMMDAVSHEAWENTRYVKWTFMGNHHFVWDKEEHLVQVKWGNYEVLLNTKQVDGIAKKDGAELSGDEKSEAIQTTWTHFCNDSFWLNAPVKVFDPGTERSIVDYDGKKALKVTYSSGGVTPGDSYVWFLDENGLPTSYKMWVSVLPIGGIEASWENWTELSTGAKIAQTRSFQGLPILKITDLAGGKRLEDVGLETNPFNNL